MLMTLQVVTGIVVLFYPKQLFHLHHLRVQIQEISNVEVFNLLGQKVSSIAVNANNVQIDMSNLSRGAYMIKATSNNQVKTIKVIKE